VVVVVRRRRRRRRGSLKECNSTHCVQIVILQAS